MDNKETVKLFNTDQSKVVLPSLDNGTNGTDNLISESIDGAISGEKVKTLLLKEDTDIAALNYIFDFTDLPVIEVMQKEALRALTSKYGDVQLYLYRKNQGLTAFGMGEKYRLERMIPIVKEAVFDNQIKIYKNFRRGEQPFEVNNKDITKMRLNL